MKNRISILLSVLFVIIASLSAYIFFNKAGLYAKIGSYYTKKDNYVTAQEYYAKSYNLGNRDKEFRDNYVNLLINSPLSIDAQQRLVDIAEDNAGDTATESAKYFLYNLKREINNKYPENYIQQAPYNQNIVHWGKIPITYTIKQPKYVSDDLVEAVNDAFDAWERASSARIRFERVNINPDIVVSFTNNKIQDAELGQKYVIAYTVPDIAQNKLNRMDMTLNTMSVDGSSFTPNQIYNIALHEVFHALGFMGHSFDKNNVMYMTNDSQMYMNDERRIISNADKATLELFYKIKPDITNANGLKYDYIPYPVLGNNAEVNYAKADEAKKYISKAPTIPAGYIDLAQTQLNEENYTAAIANLEKAYRLSDNDETKYMALYNLGVATYFEGSYELSVFYVKKAQEIKDDAELHFLLAENYIKLKRDGDAEKEYIYLLKTNPDNIDYVSNLVNIYINKRKYLQARKVLKNYVSRNPKEKNNPRFKPCKILLF